MSDESLVSPWCTWLNQNATVDAVGDNGDGKARVVLLLENGWHVAVYMPREEVARWGKRLFFDARVLVEVSEKKP